ncbi:hypothetical protein TVAG_112550 [Trichomonas vaginalis G3]|uniref:Uncharacterized protein n=1 Tax=Trichomonas vaginalis (strain ATCC PRA-98 / G3) TaxID=412133 RepID=A2G1S2_TRIV3|nr:hypothetical protein TVAG_112550 [Trichomonas vaginalis G3]|eukprot:XP_001301830.1 hypothetical protein [Trichomonas vaginalis G3]
MQLPLFFKVLPLLIKMLPLFFKVLPLLIKMLPLFFKVLPLLIKMLPHSIMQLPLLIKMLPLLIKVLPLFIKVLPLFNKGNNKNYRKSDKTSKTGRGSQFLLLILFYNIYINTLYNIFYYKIIPQIQIFKILFT